MLPADWDQTQDAGVADLDGDGAPEVLLANWMRQNRLFHNDGTGHFTDVTASLPVDTDRSNAVAMADVDADGDVDAWIANDSPPIPGKENKLYRNDGTGTLVLDPTALPPILDSSHDVVLADLDGDGDLDAYVGNYGQNELMLNDGTGHFVDGSIGLPLASDATESVALGDVDGDLDLDVLMGNITLFISVGVYDVAPNRLEVNDGQGAFTDKSSWLPPIDDATMGVALGDIDGDLDPDAMIGNWLAVGTGSSQNRLFRNQGNGKFTDVTSAQFPVVSNCTHDVTFTDLDGDGDLDAFVANAGQSEVDRNDGAGFFTDATASLLPVSSLGTTAVTLTDVEGDGDRDAVLSAGGQSRLYLGDGTGALSDATARLQSPAVDPDLALGDVDGDQDIDAFVTDFFGSDELFLNDGSGPFRNAMNQLPVEPGPWSQSAVMGDVEGDADLDILVGRIQLRPDYLAINDGTGLFADGIANLPAIQADTRSLAMGDVDADGDRDAFFGNNGQNRLYANDGSGVFGDVTATNLPTDLDATEGAVLRDLDGDGDLDLLLGTRSSQGQNRLYRNDGTGVFTDDTALSLPEHKDSTAALVVGDIDGDLDLDVLVGNHQQQNELQLNDGTGVFTDATAQLPSHKDWTLSLAIGDLDGDLDLDVLVGNETPSSSPGGQDRLLLNDGTGTFADATSQIPQSRVDTWSLALADVDGDADLDAMIGQSGLVHLHQNLTRQLSWRGTPRIGKPLAMDAYGPPGAAWILLASLAAGKTQLPYGTLLLDPATLIPIASGTLDAAGHGTVTLAVPANANLIGVSLFWQAVQGLPLALTNLEIATFTGL